MEPLAYEKTRLSTGPINYGNTPAVPPSITRNVLVNGPPAPTNPMERQFAQSADASSLKGTGPAPSAAAEALSRNAGNVTSGPVSSMANANLPSMNPMDTNAGGAVMFRTMKPNRPNSPGTGIDLLPAYPESPDVGPMPPAVIAATMPPGVGGATNASGLGMGAELDARLGIDKQVPAAVAAAAQPQVVPVPGAPGVTRTGNSYSNVPAVVAGQPSAGPAPAPSPFTGNVIQTAAGGGYTGVGFTAGGASSPAGAPASGGGVIGMDSSGMWRGNAQAAGPAGTVVDPGGRAGPAQALSNALAAAAARGDTDALVRHYGSFNGETEAGNRAAALTRQAMTLPPGSRQRAGIMQEVAAIHAGESGKAAGALAARKQRGEEAKIAGEVGKMSAEARKAQAEANMEQQRQAWTQQMAELNDQTDPDQSKRLALLDAIIASTGKSPDAKYIAIQEETGDKDLTGKSIMKTVGMNSRTGKITSAPKPKAFGEMDIKEGMKEWGLDRAGTISHLKTFGQVNVAK